MLLESLLEKLNEDFNMEFLWGSKDINFEDFQYDSRKVKENDLFIAIKGLVSDGHDFINMAIEKGATCIICEEVSVEFEKRYKNKITFIKVNNSRKALAFVANAFYKYPWSSMDLIGITGTNGKTTTTYLIQGILNIYKKKVGIIGTIENRIGEKVLKAERTTPEAKELQELFSYMVKENVTNCCMEISSHALDLYRVAYVDFKVSVFTNLSQDHLDYHMTMENYRNAKGLLFKSSENAIINIDDDNGQYMVEQCVGKVITYSINSNSDLKATNIEITSKGCKFNIETNIEKYIGKYEIFINTPGRFSVYNALGAIGACISLGVPMDIIIKGLKENKGVAGRFQSVTSDKGVQVVVDYAHTPDGLVNILNTAHEFTTGKIITVFGCGGDRDKKKRPLMGKAVGELADYVIITSDNPRSEEPMDICKDTEVGLKDLNVDYEIVVDRLEAIKRAIDISNEGDVVIIAGKGHENYQVFKDKTITFDDMLEVKKYI